MPVSRGNYSRVNGMRRLFAGTAAALLAAVLLVPVHSSALSAKSAAVMDCVSGRLLLGKAADSQSLIASTTKIMTALLVCERCNVLDQMQIPKQAVGIEGSSMYLKEGERLSIQELLYGLMLSSGNDAAVALALYCCGSIEEFANQMNDKARALGMNQTHFENPNGLDSQNHYSTAKDLAILAAYAMENPIFSKTVSTKTITIGNRMLRNHNKLLWLYPGADGVKTGFTKAAGRILVSSAMQNRRRLVAVTISDPNDWADHAAMLDQGFSQYDLRRIVTVGDCVGYREVAGGTDARVAVLAAENFTYSVSPEERPQLLLPGNGFIYAPVAEGADAGFAYVLLSGKAVGKIPVVYGQTSEMLQPEPKKTNRFLFWRKNA